MEITGTTFVCNGSDGDTVLVSTDDEPPGSNCDHGGTAVHTGLDTDGDGTLDDVEITATSYLCNGGSGDTVLVRLDVEPLGANCDFGGTAVHTGVDDDRDGVLDDLEINTTAYVCDGTVDVFTIVRMDDEPPGVNCPTGGTAVHIGLDDDGDGVLDDIEINSTSYVCNGTMPGGGGILEGNFTIRNSLDVALLSDYTGIAGDLTIDVEGMTTVSLPALGTIGGSLNMEDSDTVETLELSALTSVGGGLTIRYYDSLTGLGLSALNSIGGSVDIRDNNALTSLDSPTLSSIGGTVEIGNSSLIDLDFPTLASVGGIVEISNNSSLTGLDLPALSFVGSGIYFRNNTSATSLNLSAITSLDG